MSKLRTILSIMALTGAGLDSRPEKPPSPPSWTHDPERLAKADEKRARKNAKRAELAARGVR